MDKGDWQVTVHGIQELDMTYQLNHHHHHWWQDFYKAVKIVHQESLTC